MNSTSIGSTSRRAVNGQLWKLIGWWLFLLICVFYGGFALAMGGTEVLFRVGLVASAPLRGLPVVFVVHALAGGLVLISAPMQINRSFLKRSPTTHRILGRIHVGAIWISSAAGLWLALFFDVSIAAKLALGTVSILWFGTTTIALFYVYRREILKHGEWMIRSGALSLFFITFSLWVPGLESTPLPPAIGYPLAVFLSWSLNLAVAEIWIRRTRRTTRDANHANKTISLRDWQLRLRRRADGLHHRRLLLWAVGLLLSLAAGELLLTSLLDRSSVGAVIGGVWLVNIVATVLFIDYLLRNVESQTRGKVGINSEDASP